MFIYFFFIIKSKWFIKKTFILNKIEVYWKNLNEKLAQFYFAYKKNYNWKSQVYFFRIKYFKDTKQAMQVVLIICLEQIVSLVTRNFWPVL